MGKTYAIGIDAGGTKVAYGLFDGDTLIDRQQHPTDAAADGPAFADTLIENIRVLLRKNRLTPDSLSGVGVCMPSFILFDEGRILMTSVIPGIKDFPMRDYLRERLGVNVALDNDSNAAALAEYRHGAGRGSRHMVYMTVGTGVGSGIVIDGSLFRGSYGWAGECGHMLATPKLGRGHEQALDALEPGKTCGCENAGCFMPYASGWAIPALVGSQLAAGVPSVLTAEADGVQLLAACRENDAAAIAVVDQIAHALAVCLFNVYQMLNINLFVFGGGLTRFGDVLFSRVRREFDRYNHIPLPVYFRTAELTEDFGIIGAAEFLKG